MFKAITFSCRLDDINCMTEKELHELMERVGAAIAGVHTKSALLSRADVEIVEPEVQHTSLGDAAIDGFMKVKRKDGRPTEFFHNVNGQSHPITEAAYNAAHGS